MSKIFQFRICSEGDEVAAKAFLGRLLEGNKGMTVEVDEEIIQLTLWRKNEAIHGPGNRPSTW